MKAFRAISSTIAAVIILSLAGSTRVHAQDNRVRLGIAAGVELPYGFGAGYDYIRPFGEGRVYTLGGHLGVDLYLPISTGFHLRPQIQPYYNHGYYGNGSMVGIRLPVMIGYTFGYNNVVSMPLALGGYADWHGYDFKNKCGFGTFAEALDYGFCASAGLRFGRIFMDYRFLYSLAGINTAIAYRDRWHMLASTFSIGYYF